jgi:hypothetical protein
MKNVFLNGMTLKKRDQHILDNEEYKLAKQLMTMSRLCGLLQSDGHFTVTYDKQKVQNPKIILTQTNQRITWLYGIQDWLSSLGIRSVLPTNQTLHQNILNGRSINCIIDRVNCRKLLFLIEETERVKKTPLLFDNKRVNYLLLKESIKIKQSSHQKTLTKTEATMLVDIKESGLKLSQGPKGLLRDQLIERLGFPELQTKGCASFLIQEIKKKVEASGVEVLKILLDDPRQINSALAESIAGVLDGDGSIRIGLFTHLSKDGKKLDNRHTFEIVPSIHITSHIEETSYLFKIINAVFGKKESMTIVNVNNSGKGRRLVIKNIKVLKEHVLPFFAKYQSSIQKNRIRLNIFCKILQELPLDYQNKERVIEMVREIYANDLYERDKSLDHFLNIVELDYN